MRRRWRRSLGETAGSGPAGASGSAGVSGASATESSAAAAAGSSAAAGAASSGVASAAASAAVSSAPSGAFLSSSSAIDGLSGRGHGRVQPALAGDGQRPREVALGAAQAGGVLELARRMLEAQAEQVAARRRDALEQRLVVEVSELAGGHACRSSRRTNLVFTGSLWPARRMASRASGSGTPDSSNITRPGLTTATQPSGLPLPDPMRVSAGFFVNGLSG